MGPQGLKPEAPASLPHLHVLAKVQPEPHARLNPDPRESRDPALVSPELPTGRGGGVSWGLLTRFPRVWSDDQFPVQWFKRSHVKDLPTGSAPAAPRVFCVWPRLHYLGQETGDFLIPPPGGEGPVPPCFLCGPLGKHSRLGPGPALRGTGRAPVAALTGIRTLDKGAGLGADGTSLPPYCGSLD